MMQEKDMVNDVLSMLKNSIAGYAHIIAEAGNEQFRQTVQQMRMATKNANMICLR